MNLVEYQKAAIKFAVYPGAGTGDWIYPLLGLCEEYAEFVEAVGAVDSVGHLCSDLATNIRAELGDVYWNFVTLCYELKIDINSLDGPVYTPYNPTSAFISIGKIQGILAKVVRDSGFYALGLAGLGRIPLNGLLAHLGALLSRLNENAEAHGGREQILSENLTKLEGRASRGTLHGDGDR